MSGDWKDCRSQKETRVQNMAGAKEAAVWIKRGKHFAAILGLVRRAISLELRLTKLGGMTNLASFRRNKRNIKLKKLSSSPPTFSISLFVQSTVPLPPSLPPPLLSLAGVTPTLWPLGCSSSAARRDKGCTETSAHPV